MFFIFIYNSLLHFMSINKTVTLGPILGPKEVQILKRGETVKLVPILGPQKDVKIQHII